MCEECNTVIPRDESFHHPREGYTLCGGCYEECEEESEDSTRSSFVHAYGYKPSPCFYPSVNPAFLYFGVELETDGYNKEGLDLATQDLYALSTGDSLFYLKYDSSLHSGVEIVTHPATLEYHRKTFPWDAIQEVVRTNGGKSHDVPTCGLHIHFNASYLAKRADSDPWYRQVRKLMALFQRNYVPLYEFSRRGNNDYTEPLPLFKPNQSLDGVKDFKRGRRGRSYIINIEPRNSVEVRLFRGTLRHETMIAAIELTDFMVRFAKRSSWATINGTSWEDLVGKMKAGNYEYLPTYLARMPESTRKGDSDSSSAPLHTEPIDEAPLAPAEAKEEAEELSLSDMLIDPVFSSRDFMPSAWGSRTIIGE